MKFPQAEALSKNIVSARQQDAALVSTVTKVQQPVNIVATELQRVEALVKKIDQIDQSAQAVSRMLSLCTVLPVVGSTCSSVKSGIDDFRNVVKPVREQADKVSSKIKPFAKRVQQLDSQLQQGITDLKKVDRTLVKEQQFCNQSRKCIEKTESVEAYKAFQEIVKTLDPINQAILTLFQQTNNELAKGSRELETLSEGLESLKRLEKVLDQFNGLLKEVSKATRTIKQSLKQKITVPYKYKVKVKTSKKKWWKVAYVWEWQWKTETYSFTLGDIVRGVDTGVSFVNKQLMKMAKQALRQLDIKLPSVTKLPGVKQATSALIAIEHKVVNSASTLATAESKLIKCCNYRQTLNSLLTTLENPCDKVEENNERS